MVVLMEMMEMGDPRDMERASVPPARPPARTSRTIPSSPRFFANYCFSALHINFRRPHRTSISFASAVIFCPPSEYLNFASRDLSRHSSPCRRASDTPALPIRSCPYLHARRITHHSTVHKKSRGACCPGDGLLGAARSGSAWRWHRAALASRGADIGASARDSSSKCRSRTAI